jgi:MHS family proline/betaine transporter-like MFS transporter
VLILVVSACGLMAAGFSGVAPTTLSELFPTPVRATGVSLAYNAGFTLFGGFAPAILAWFAARGAGSTYAPAWFVMLAAIPALAALRFQAGRRAAAALVALESR